MIISRWKAGRIWRMWYDLVSQVCEFLQRRSCKVLLLLIFCFSLRSAEADISSFFRNSYCSTNGVRLLQRWHNVSEIYPCYDNVDFSQDLLAIARCWYWTISSSSKVFITEYLRNIRNHLPTVRSRIDSSAHVLLILVEVSKAGVQPK